MNWFWQGYSGFPYLAIPLLLCTIPVIANQKGIYYYYYYFFQQFFFSNIFILTNLIVYIFAWFLLFIAAKDALEILSSQLGKWWSMGQPLYINELMVKKKTHTHTIIVEI